MIRSGLRNWKTSDAGAALLSVETIEKGRATVGDGGATRGSACQAARGLAVRARVLQRHDVNLARGRRPHYYYEEPLDQGQRHLLECDTYQANVLLLQNHGHSSAANVEISFFHVHVH